MPLIDPDNYAPQLQQCARCKVQVFGLWTPKNICNNCHRADHNAEQAKREIVQASADLHTATANCGTDYAVTLDTLVLLAARGQLAGVVALAEQVAKEAN